MALPIKLYLPSLQSGNNCPLTQRPKRPDDGLDVVHIAEDLHGLGVALAQRLLRRLQRPLAPAPAQLGYAAVVGCLQAGVVATEESLQVLRLLRY